MTSARSKLTLAFFPTKCGEGLGWVVSGFLSALKFCASKFLPKLCPSFLIRTSMGTVRVEQLFSVVLPPGHGVFWCTYDAVTNLRYWGWGYPSSQGFALVLRLRRQERQQAGKTYRLAELHLSCWMPQFPASKICLLPFVCNCSFFLTRMSSPVKVAPENQRQET